MAAGGAGGGRGGSVGVWCAGGVVGMVRWWHLAGGMGAGLSFYEI